MSAWSLDGPHRKMSRTLDLTVQGDFGLTEGQAWWMDANEIVFHCPEELLPGQAHDIRVDLGHAGRTVDVRARIVEVYNRRQARIRFGFLHVASYELLRPQEREPLLELLGKINPAAFDERRDPSSVRGVSVTPSASARDASSRSSRRPRFRLGSTSTRGSPASRPSPSSTTPPGSVGARADAATRPTPSAPGSATEKPSQRVPSSRPSRRPPKVSGRRERLFAVRPPASESATPAPGEEAPAPDPSPAGSLPPAPDPDTLSPATISDGTPRSLYVHFRTPVDLSRAMVSLDPLWMDVRLADSTREREVLVAAIQLPDLSFVQVDARVLARLGPRAVRLELLAVGTDRARLLQAAGG